MASRTVASRFPAHKSRAEQFESVMEITERVLTYHELPDRCPKPPTVTPTRLHRVRRLLMAVGLTLLIAVLSVLAPISRVNAASAPRRHHANSN